MKNLFINTLLLAFCVFALSGGARTKDEDEGTQLAANHWLSRDSSHAGQPCDRRVHGDGKRRQPVRLLQVDLCRF